MPLSSSPRNTLAAVALVLATLGTAKCSNNQANSDNAGDTAQIGDIEGINTAPENDEAIDEEIQAIENNCGFEAFQALASTNNILWETRSIYNQGADITGISIADGFSVTPTGPHGVFQMDTVRHLVGPQSFHEISTAKSISTVKDDTSLIAQCAKNTHVEIICVVMEGKNGAAGEVVIDGHGQINALVINPRYITARIHFPADQDHPSITFSDTVNLSTCEVTGKIEKNRVTTEEDTIPVCEGRCEEVKNQAGAVQEATGL